MRCLVRRLSPTSCVRHPRLGCHDPCALCAGAAALDKKSKMIFDAKQLAKLGAKPIKAQKMAAAVGKGGRCWRSIQGVCFRWHVERQTVRHGGGLMRGWPGCVTAWPADGYHKACRHEAVAHREGGPGDRGGH